MNIRPLLFLNCFICEGACLDQNVKHLFRRNAVTASLMPMSQDAAAISHVLDVTQALVKDGHLASHPLLLQTGLLIKTLVDMSSAHVNDPASGIVSPRAPVSAVLTITKILLSL